MASDSPFSAFGSNKPPKEVFQRYVRPELAPLRDLGKSALSSLSTGGAAAENQFNLGTGKQQQLLGEHENAVRSILNNRLNFNPTQLLGDVGRTAFSFIDPNVVSPLAKFDVNYNNLMRRVRGLNPAAVDSTAQRLRDARIASGRYYDVARQVYGALPSLYNQAFNAGLSSDDFATGLLPQVMQGYRSLDVAPLQAAMLRADAANAGADIVRRAAEANKAATYGFQQPKNVWDRLGDMDTAAWGRLKDAVQMYSSLYGGGMLGGMGGMGGMGGGGGASTASPTPAPQPRFIPMQPSGSLGNYEASPYFA